MKRPQLPELSMQIEQLIQGHIATCRRVAQEAVARAFDAAAALPSAASKNRASTKPGVVTGQQGRRRSRAELREISERFYLAVCADPGETLAFLSLKLGIRVPELHRPMALLRQAKRIRSAGPRHHTRYFPMCDGDAVDAAA